MKHLRQFYIFFLLLILIGFDVWANEKIEKIEVTGSRIKRINIEGPSPITIIDSKEIEESPYNSVSEILQDRNINPFSGSSIHAAKTLFLINGRRVVENSSESSSLGTVAPEAIERIEIIKDGSSAIYGSDALGGVINFITKKNIEGIQVQLKIIPVFFSSFINDLSTEEEKGLSAFFKNLKYDNIDFHTGGNEVQGSVLWGKSNPNGHITSVFNFSANDSVYGDDRPSKWSGPLYSPYSIYPVFKPAQGGELIFHNDCPQELRQPQQGCFYEYTYTTNIVPKSLGGSLFVESSYKRNGIDYYFQSSSIFGKSASQSLPAPAAIRLNDGHQLSVGTGLAGSLLYRFQEAGPRESLSTSLIMDNSFGARTYLSSIWEVDLNFKASGTYGSSVTANTLLRDEVTKAINQGQFDPFTTDKRSLDPNFVHDASLISKSLFFSGDLIFTGSIKDINLAFGLQSYQNRYIIEPDDQIKAGKVLSVTQVNDKHDKRSVIAAFAESSYFVGDNFELQLAVRGDYYSDFKETINPKAAFRYNVNDNFLIRGSVGTSFIAPRLEELNRPTTQSLINFTDYPVCFNQLKQSGAFNNISDEELIKDFFIDQKRVFDDPQVSEDAKVKLEQLSSLMREETLCQSSDYSVRYQGNKDLKETKGITASVSSVFQINDDTNFIIDFWYLRINGSPSYGVGSDMSLAELKLGTDHVEQQGIKINRDANGFVLKTIGSDALTGLDTSLLNIGEQKLTGIDFEFSSSFSNRPFKGGYFYFTDKGTIALYSKIQRFPGLGVIDVIGRLGLPRWRNIATVGWSNKNYSAHITLHTAASTLKATKQRESLPISRRVDLGLTWQKDHKTNFTLGAQNIFNRSQIDDSIVRGFKIGDILHSGRGPNVYFGFKRTL